MRAQVAVNIHNIVGPIVEGEDFFARIPQLAELRTLAVQQNVLISAPRRVGKTSLLHRLRSDLRAAGDHAIWTTVEGCRDEFAFVRVIATALENDADAKKLAKPSKWKALKRLLDETDTIKLGALGGTVEIKRTVDHRWQHASEALTELLRALTQTSEQWYLMLDELPLLIHQIARVNQASAESLLTWFRSVRQQFGPSQGIHWIVAGSIGLHTVTERYSLTAHINDFIEYPLGAFSEQEAKDFLQALCRTYKLQIEDEITIAICTRIGWLAPHFLQVIFAELKSIATRHSSDQSKRVIDHSVLDDAFSVAAGRGTYFNPWYERLSLILTSPRDEHAKVILDLCAQDITGVTEQSISGSLAATIVAPEARTKELNHLLGLLKSDGYLVKENERWKFRSGLLREYWAQRLAS